MMQLVRAASRSMVDTFGNAVLSPPFGGFGYFRNHGSRDEKKIALTFDDGPSKPSTERLLDTLGELGVTSTFFCIGQQIQSHPDLLRRMEAERHVVGNHSMWHARADSLQLTNSDHIDDCGALIASVLGKRPRLYRPPWGWLPPWEGARLAARDYVIVGWDVYTLDWKLPEVQGDILADGICRDVQPGSIVLLHDANGVDPRSHKSQMTEAVKVLVPRLRNEGFVFVTAAELLGVSAYGSVAMSR